MADQKPTIVINDRLSASLSHYRRTLPFNSKHRERTEWWVPWAKELEEKLAIAQHDLREARTQLEELNRKLKP